LAWKLSHKSLADVRKNLDHDMLGLAMATL